MTIKAERENYRRFQKKYGVILGVDKKDLRDSHVRFLRQGEYASQLGKLTSGLTRLVGQGGTYESPNILAGQGTNLKWVAHISVSNSEVYSAGMNTNESLKVGLTVLRGNDKSIPLPSLPLEKFEQPEEFTEDYLSHHTIIEDLIDLLQREFLSGLAKANRVEIKFYDEKDHDAGLSPEELDNLIHVYKLVCSEYPDEMEGSHIRLGCINNPDDYITIRNALYNSTGIRLDRRSKYSLIRGKEIPMSSDGLGLYRSTNHTGKSYLDLLFK